jgi:hypothetical protein
MTTNNTLQLKIQNPPPELYNSFIRDKWIQQIEDQIKTKKQLLSEKRKYLEKTKEENKYLEGVKQDYEKYKNHIVREKQEQLIAMNILKQYTDYIRTGTEITEETIHKTREDQKHILREIKKIKQGLDELIE